MPASASHLPSPQSSPASSPRKRPRPRSRAMSPSEDELASDSDRDDHGARSHGSGSGTGVGSETLKRRKHADGTARRALEVKREKNRIKQRNLRERRANHVADLEQTVSRLQKAVREHAARLAAAGAREDALVGYARALESALVAAGSEDDAAALRRAWPAAALVRDRPAGVWGTRADDRDRDREMGAHDQPNWGSPEPLAALLAASAALAPEPHSMAGPSRQPYPTPTHEPLGAWPAGPRDLDFARTQTLPPLRLRDAPLPAPAPALRPLSSSSLSAPIYSPSYAPSPALSPAALTTFPALAPLPPLSSGLSGYMHPSTRWSTLPPPPRQTSTHTARPPLARASESTALSLVTAHRAHGADDSTSPSRVSISELCTPLALTDEPGWPAAPREKDAPVHWEKDAQTAALPPISSFAPPRTADDGQRRISEISTVDALLCPSRRESA
ncbi:hypothetical protein Q5752_003818 [Cryptotrichosporon argae]